ncbi:type IV secretory system conjugative DNA transfer family protein [Oceanibium sediminis]|uniref:type IV secretory system conjugative DNA transfer family protein n=1 Tax=Oceanibium sediminis TaxID=2026339 RepID=UPI000DD39892|nr:type IV secretory system conjugative DNA transfer family protein [Oceanibium sediminis]
MKKHNDPNPVGKMLAGGIIAAVTWKLVVPLNSHSDPVSALALGALFLAGVWVIGVGVLDLFGVILLRIARWRAETPTGIFGEAKFADLRDCADFGLTDPAGLFLGALKGVPLFFKGKAHLLTVAPARQGKGIAVVIANLLHFWGSIFVTDPKGELAAITARVRQVIFRQTTIFLNPGRLHDLPSHRYNPLQPLIDIFADPRRHHELGDAVRGIVLQLIPEPAGGDKNQYFRDGARNLLEGLILFLVTRDRPEKCTLPELWRIVKNTRRLELTFEVMADSDALDGMVADYGEEFLFQMEDGAKQFADFRTGVSNALQIFRPGGPLAKSVSASDFRFEDLKAKGTTIYVMIPAEHIATYAPWLGLITQQAIKAVARNKGDQQVLCLLDEFANLGRLAGLAEALTLLPGYGVRVWAIVQDLSQLVQVYGRETANIILSQAEVKQFFAVQDFDLAQRLSKLLGERSIITRNYNLGQRPEDEIGVSASERGVPLMLPQEIMTLPPEQQLLFVKSAPPVLAEKVAYWDVAPWRDWADPNPMEGDHPRSGKPVFRLRYSGTGSKS